MKIIGFNITNILAEKKSELKGNVNVSSGLHINKITEEKVNFTIKPAFQFEYTYTLNYVPGLASIQLKGNVLAIIDEEKSEDIIKNWDKKDFNSTVKLALYNFVLNKCNLKALNLEEDLSLPSHIPFPKLSVNPEALKSEKTDKKSKLTNYTG